ncbi:MAG: hypothetical protein LJE91_07120 [Gammaproteobacteria bacterium]|jgi:hypothetical protein|nr:hypothetical protein [Gammaproteobacteria bacterium]
MPWPTRPRPTNPRLGPRETACTALVEAFGVALDEVYLSYLNDLSGSLEQSD